MVDVLTQPNLPSVEKTIVTPRRKAVALVGGTDHGLGDLLGLTHALRSWDFR